MAAIKMLNNTWGGDKRRLGKGTTHQVPEEVSRADAEKLVNAGKAEWMEPEQAPEVTLAEIVEAIGRLDRDVPGNWTADGKPWVEAIEAVLGRPVTAAQRDAAVDSLKD